MKKPSARPRRKWPVTLAPALDAWAVRSRALLIALLLGLCHGALASEAADLARSTAALEEVQRSIRQLDEAIARTQKAHAEASAGLAEAERAVSQGRRRLRSLDAQRVQAEEELAAAERQLAEVAERIELRRVELADLLRQHYMHGGSGVAPFLSGGDPNRIARDAHYLEHVGRARLTLIEGLRADQREQQRLAAEASAKRDRNAEVLAAQRKEQAGLERAQAKRAALAAKLAGSLRGQTREVEALRENEQHLGQMVELLQRQADERARAAALASSAPPSRTHSGSLASAAPSGTPFQRLRGKLGRPVQGDLSARFGAPTGVGGTRWRGLFFRAGSGAEVRAVAEGQVVFSDWMRGYGNLVIIDHGSDYLTIYANNDALLRTVGERVQGGTPIAQTGASGGAWETGLYFELRHKGEPVDPLQWLRGG